MNPNRIKIIQTLGELLIPLLGYFFWNWNFYFIALFYLLDLLANTSFLPLKINKITSYKVEKKQIILYFLLYIILLSALTFGGILVSENLLDNFNLQEQTYKFIMLKDMGLAQGFFLIPLLIYAAYMQYKMEFLLPKRFEKVSINSLLKKHTLGLLISCLFIFLGYGISCFLKIPEIAAVLTLILLTSAYSFWFKRS